MFHLRTHWKSRNNIILPIELSEFTIYFLIVVSMLTSFVSAAFGIGGGAILLGLLALKLPPIALLPIHGVVQIGSNLGRAVIFFKDIKRGPLIPFTLGTIFGASLGGSIFIQIEPWLIQLAVAIFILWSVFGKNTSYWCVSYFFWWNFFWFSYYVFWRFGNCCCWNGKDYEVRTS